VKNWSLAKSISFHCYPAFSAIVDHATGQMLRLNAVGGRILSAIREGVQPISEEERAFCATLEQHGILADSNRIPGEAAPQFEARPPARPPAAVSQVMLDLKEMAKRDTIPLQLQAELTYRCPLACAHCYLQGESDRTRDEMSTNQWQRILDDWSGLGGLFVTFTGGEPFARADLEAIVAHARSRYLAVSLLTSGQGATPERIRNLAGLWLDAVQVSLYSTRSDRHDRLVGRVGAFDQAWRCLIGFRDLGVPVRAAVCVHRQNIDDIPDLVEKLRSEGIRPNFNTVLLPHRNRAKPDEDLALSDEQLRAFLRTYGRTEHFRMRGLKPDDPPCAAGGAVISISPEGDVYPCLMWREAIGSLVKDAGGKPVDNRLESIFLNSNKVNKIRGIKTEDLKQCVTCEYRDFCNRCPALAVQAGLTEYSKSPLDCRQAMLYHTIVKE
jgi:pyrroloquinoline quinone biosynthesis protein E